MHIKTPTYIPTRSDTILAITYTYLHIESHKEIYTFYCSRTHTHATHTHTYHTKYKHTTSHQPTLRFMYTYIYTHML